MGIPKPEEHDPDVLLVEALQAGDTAVLDEFIQRNERWIRGVVYSVLGNSGQVDDVLQRIWMTIWQRIGTLEDPRRWKHWIYRMARNASIDMGRGTQRRRNLWQKVVRQNHGKFETKITPQRTAEIQETHNTVLEAIDQMPAIYKEPFVLRHVEQWTYREIASALNLPIDTVGTRLVRARRLLKETLERKGM